MSLPPMPVLSPVRLARFLNLASSAPDPINKRVWLEQYITILQHDAMVYGELAGNLKKAAAAIEWDYQATWRCRCGEGLCGCALRDHGLAIEVFNVHTMKQTSRVLGMQREHMKNRLRRAKLVLTALNQRINTAAESGVLAGE